MLRDLSRGKAKKSVHCVETAMKRIICTNPRAFFERAEREKTSPRKINLDDEVKNFLLLKEWKDLASLHAIPKFIIAYAESVNMSNKKGSKRFPAEILRARFSSGRESGRMVGATT